MPDILIILLSVPFIALGLIELHNAGVSIRPLRRFEARAPILAELLGIASPESSRRLRPHREPHRRANAAVLGVVIYFGVALLLIGLGIRLTLV